MDNKYFLINFLMDREIYIPSRIQERELFPFTMACAKRFFANFEKHSFNFDGTVKSMYLFDAKENLPRHSYANIHLYSYSLDELSPIAIADWPNPVGILDLECGGSHASPIMRVRRWG